MSGMTNYEEYLPEVLTEVDCPQLVAINEIRNTIIDFCKFTTVFRKDIVPKSIIANQGNYDIETDNEETVIGLRWAYLINSTGEEIKIDPMSEDELDKGTGRRFRRVWRNKTGRVQWFYSPDINKVTLVYIPESAYTLYAGAWVVPSRKSIEAPTIIYEKYLEAIAHGAKSRLLKMTTRPWYDKLAWKEEHNMYISGRSDAFIDVNKSNTRKGRSVQMRPIA